MIFRVLGTVILLMFYGCYFGKMISQRKKGIETDQIGKGKAGRVKFIELTMKLATYLVPIAEVVSIALNTSPLPQGVRIAGVCVGFAGVFVFILSVVTMRDSWRAGVSEKDRTELVTEGIYTISRNPAFLGFDLVYIGLAMMFFNWVLFICSLFAAVMFHIQIVNVEEKFLINAFGDEYARYKGSVNRYLGRRRR